MSESSPLSSTLAFYAGPLWPCPVAGTALLEKSKITWNEVFPLCLTYSSLWSTLLVDSAIIVLEFDDNSVKQVVLT